MTKTIALIAIALSLYAPVELTRFILVWRESALSFPLNTQLIPWFLAWGWSMEITFLWLAWLAGILGMIVLLVHRKKRRGLDTDTPPVV